MKKYKTPRFIVMMVALCVFYAQGCQFTPRAWIKSWFAKSSGSTGVLGESRANAELLAELYQVVYMSAPPNDAEFAAYLSNLDEGASMIGVYNGFTHSSRYRDFEVTDEPANRVALERAGSLLEKFEHELITPTSFREDARLPLAKPVDVEYEDSRQLKADSPRSMTEAKVLAAEAYAKFFKGASLFTLKRVVGDEALKVIDQKKTDRDHLAQWYSDWAVQAAAYGVDFGLQLRGLADSDFHHQWANDVSVDSISWEVLNRLHRLLNDTRSTEKKGG